MEMNAGRIIAVIFQRSWIKVIRRPMILLLSFVQPMIWMLFFGFLFQRFNLGLADENLDYIDYLLPGVCAMTVLLGASQSGISFIRDLQTGFLTRLLTTPSGHHWLLIGKIAADVSRLLLQATIVGLLGILLGAEINPTAWSLLQSMLALTLFSTGYVCLSCYVALRTQSQESMAAFIHLVNMPLFFTSTALVPSKLMPAWLEVVATWNPFSLVVNLIREALLYGECSSAIITLGSLSALTSFLFWLALQALKASR